MTAMMAMTIVVYLEANVAKRVQHDNGGRLKIIDPTHAINVDDDSDVDNDDNDDNADDGGVDNYDADDADDADDDADDELPQP